MLVKDPDYYSSSMALQPKVAFTSIMYLLQTLGQRPHYGFLIGSILRGGGVNPTPNSQPGGPSLIFITPGTECPL
jgi:hypothetical protein